MELCVDSGKEMSVAATSETPRPSHVTGSCVNASLADLIRGGSGMAVCAPAVWGRVAGVQGGECTAGGAQLWATEPGVFTGSQGSLPLPGWREWRT